MIDTHNDIPWKCVTNAVRAEFGNRHVRHINKFDYYTTRSLKLKNTEEVAKNRNCFCFCCCCCVELTVKKKVPYTSILSYYLHLINNNTHSRRETSAWIAGDQIRISIYLFISLDGENTKRMKRERRRHISAAAHCTHTHTYTHMFLFTYDRPIPFWAQLIEIERELENEIIEIKTILARRKRRKKKIQNWNWNAFQALRSRSLALALLHPLTRASDPSEAEGRRTSHCAGGCAARVAGLSLSVAARCCVRLVLLFIRLVRYSPCAVRSFASSPIRPFVRSALSCSLNARAHTSTTNTQTPTVKRATCYR